MKWTPLLFDFDLHCELFPALKAAVGLLPDLKAHTAPTAAQRRRVTPGAHCRRLVPVRKYAQRRGEQTALIAFGARLARIRRYRCGASALVHAPARPAGLYTADKDPSSPRHRGDAAARQRRPSMQAEAWPSASYQATGAIAPCNADELQNLASALCAPHQIGIRVAFCRSGTSQRREVLEQGCFPAQKLCAA
jgi:hypothetical protein